MCAGGKSRTSPQTLWGTLEIEVILFILSESRADDNQLNDASGRITSTSTIRFRPTAADNGVTWACEAEHQAIVYSPLRASVLLSVLRKFPRPKKNGRDSRILLVPKRRPLHVGLAPDFAGLCPARPLIDQRTAISIIHLSA